MTARPTTLRKFAVWAPLVAYMALIFYVSSQSSTGWNFRYPDKLVHFLEYGALALLLARALNGGIRKPVPAKRLVVAGLLALGYALTDEFHQSFTPNRVSDWRDVVADALGAATALLLLAFLGRLFFRDAAAGAAGASPHNPPVNDLARKEPT